MTQARERGAALLAEYTEVNQNFRLLTEIRFKLLAFLPLIAAAGLAAAGVGRASGAAPGLEGAIFLFGLVVTCALATYNARNDQLYVRLVARAAEIERELELPDGSFNRRPTAWLEISFGFGRWPIGHVSGVSAMYGATIALWLTGLLVAATQLAIGSGPMPWWAYVAAACVGVGAVGFGTGVIRRQRETREDRLVSAGERALEMAPVLLTTQGKAAVAALECHQEFVSICRELFGRDRHRTWAEAEIRRRIGYYAELSREERHRHGFDDPERGNLNYLASVVNLPAAMLTVAPRRR